MTRNFGGVGLGLMLSKRIAEALGGAVSLGWTEPGVGSAFVFDLPTEFSSKSYLKSFQ